MLIVKIGKKENINQALKRFKRKVSKSKMMKEIREKELYEAFYEKENSKA